MLTGFSVSRLDAKIKNVISSRTQLVGELQKVEDIKVPYLPEDCWRFIINFLDQPQDVLNLGSVNRSASQLANA